MRTLTKILLVLTTSAAKNINLTFQILRSDAAQGFGVWTVFRNEKSSHRMKDVELICNEVLLYLISAIPPGNDSFSKSPHLKRQVWTEGSTSNFNRLIEDVLWNYGSYFSLYTTFISEVDEVWIIIVTFFCVFMNLWFYLCTSWLRENIQKRRFWQRNVGSYGSSDSNFTRVMNESSGRLYNA